ncbi:MAG: tetratricopeptide repeat protein [Planctomycetota bacterium]
MMEKSNRESKLKRTTPKTVQITSSKVLTSSRTVREVPHKKSTETGQKRKSMNLKSVDRTSISPRKKETIPENQKNVRNTPKISRTRDTIVNNSTVVTESKHPIRLDKRSERHRFHRDEGRFSRIRYEEHSNVRHRTHRHEHIYRDRHNRICHRLIWPRYYFPVYYSHGPFFTFRYVYPYYHRKYIFVSLGGYWPVDYSYLRYYWYGWHPYDWYGYYPIAREVRGGTYNYYTYNYYYADAAATSDYTGAATGIRPVDHTTFADVRERLAQQQAQEPESETLADAYFDEAVKAFEAGDYETAADKFARAMEFAPDDMVLPFAYAQALFAGEKYSQAAEVLRLALEKVTPEKEGVFYPRGLYPDEDILFEQIDRLAEKAYLYSYDADLQFLLGYQLLGIGQVDEAVEPLQRASLDLKNSTAAAILLDLLEKIRANNAEDASQ